MKELNFIFLLIVICSISTVLLVISFFCYCNQRPHQHNIVNINHQSIDSGFGKLPIQIAYISILYILFFFFRRNMTKNGLTGHPRPGIRTTSKTRPAVSITGYPRPGLRAISNSRPAVSSTVYPRKKMRKKVMKISGSRLVTPLFQL